MFGVSGFILYQQFGGTPRGYLPNRGFGQTEARVAEQSVKTLDANIDEASRNLDSDGIWKDVEANKQYLELSAEYINPIEIGEYGNRENPFLPLVFETEEDNE